MTEDAAFGPSNLKVVLTAQRPVLRLSSLTSECGCRSTDARSSRPAARGEIKVV
jgi:hypothetical protein